MRITDYMETHPYLHIYTVKIGVELVTRRKLQLYIISSKSLQDLHIVQLLLLFDVPETTCT